MPWSIGINFRATAGYVTDGAGETYVLGEAYPTTRGGETFGWNATAGVQPRDRNSGIDARLAGTHFLATTAARDFRVDLPSAGTYIIRLALGDAGGSGIGHALDLEDDTTVFASLSAVPGTAEWEDASAVVRTSAADWVSNNVSIQHTFTSTIFRLDMGTHADTTTRDRISHLYIEAAATSAGMNRRKRASSQAY